MNDQCKQSRRHLSQLSSITYIDAAVNVMCKWWPSSSSGGSGGSKSSNVTVNVRYVMSGLKYYQTSRRKSARKNYTEDEILKVSLFLFKCIQISSKIFP